MSPRVALVIIGAVFFLPMALAWLMYTGKIEFRPVETRNRGELVQPLVPVSWDGVTGVGARDQTPGPGVFEPAHVEDHWTVLHALPAHCDSACVAHVTELRQVHRASGRQLGRIRLVLLQPAADTSMATELRRIYPQFEIATDTGGSLEAALERVATEHGTTGGTAGSTYLIDPLGNIMMYYEAGSDPNDLKSDLKRLLTWSKLDEQS
jgi:hypothetical protein